MSINVLKHDQQVAHYRKIKEDNDGRNEAVKIAVLCEGRLFSQGIKNVYGIKAVHYYLMQKFHWPMTILKEMSVDDMILSLSEELSEANELPLAAKDVVGH
jgi:hypothetical protein